MKHISKDTAVSAPLLNGKYYMIKMKKLMLGQTQICKESDAFCKTVIDTGTSSIRGPNDIVTKFLKDDLGKLLNECIT